MEYLTQVLARHSERVLEHRQQQVERELLSLRPEW